MTDFRAEIHVSGCLWADLLAGRVQLNPSLTNKSEFLAASLLLAQGSTAKIATSGRICDEETTENLPVLAVALLSGF